MKRFSKFLTEASTKAPINSNQRRLQLFGNALVHFKDEIVSAVGGQPKTPVYCVYAYYQRGPESWKGNDGSHEVTMFVEHPTETDKMLVFTRRYNWTYSRALWNNMKVEVLPKAAARTLWTTLSNQEIVGSRLDVAQVKYTMADNKATVMSKNAKIS
jgi:hypothetical protein